MPDSESSAILSALFGGRPNPRNNDVGEILLEDEWQVVKSFISDFLSEIDRRIDAGEPIRVEVFAAFDDEIQRLVRGRIHA